MKTPRYFTNQDQTILIGPHTLEYMGDYPGIRLTKSECSIKIANQKKWMDQVTLVISGTKAPLKLRISLAENIKIRLDLYYLVNPGTETIELDLSLAKGANLELTNVYSGTKSTFLQVHRCFQLHTNSSLNLHTGCLVDGAVHFTDQTNLQGDQSTYTADFLAIAGGNDRFDAVQMIDHHQPHTTSHVVNLLVAAGSAKMNVDVTGTIRKGNFQSVCHQQNRGIILEALGTIAVEPKLIIDEYDVDAGHGCAIGDINADEMYYLQSRGMDETTAKRLIVSGYLRPLYQRIANPSYLRRIVKTIEIKLKGANL
jgi:Fe-S cluster assembly protein SufD